MIKRSSGKLTFASDIVEQIAASRFLPLPISFAHAAHAGALPPLHDDPFDRMLVAQAQIEGLTIVTRDAEIPRYQVAVLPA